LISHQDEEFLAAAVARARMARRKGVGDQTVVIMREMLSAALNRTGRRFKFIIGVLIVLLIGVSAYGFWKIEGLKKDKRQIDTRIAQIESILATPGETPGEADALVDQLDQYENQARALKSNFLYKVSAFERESPVEREIHVLMAEFGAETYSIPPEFLEQVKRFIERYQGPDRPHMARAEGEARQDMNTMRQIFEQQSLPPDLAYIVLVESALGDRSKSQAGAAGLWQFTPVTAKAYGLKVSREVDARFNAQKATRAACKYIRDLILDFGSGSSVMLALAAYNLGPSRVKQAIRKVPDPIKQRNFWYLYRVRAVPPETREYVPKVIAAMVIGRHPERFGF
jgi:soluble lytic murein transglycosylase-like protein